MARRERSGEETRYPPIAEYAYISDCHSSALVSRDASIDWCCMPRIDSSSCFGRLLDWDGGGKCLVRPAVPFESERRYVGDTLVLETTFRTASGEAKVIDCFTMREGGRHEPHKQLLRVVEGVRGRVPFDVHVEPRFDYGAVKPWIREAGGPAWIVLGGCDGLVLSGDMGFAMDGRHCCRARFEIGEGERRRLSLVHGPPENLDDGIAETPDPAELDRRLDETTRWWKTWASHMTYDGRFREQALRSALVLKGLSNAPTGAIAAAATTSLPEAPGGPRNWDYRYTWIRDSAFTVLSLAELGFESEADGFRRFIERTAAGSADELQVLFGVDGGRRLAERELPELEGYRGARPVRVGNGAVDQRQFDIYGELLDLAWKWHERGNSPDGDYWEFIVEILGRVSREWREPDQGIWEVRGGPRHFVLSKAMCWVAFDRGVRLAESRGEGAAVEEWKRERGEIRRVVEEKGYDPGRGVFIQAFGHPVMDAALLLLPVFGFVDAADDRMVRTVDAIRDDLMEDGLLRRYPHDDDSLDGREGVFLACSFWLVRCLAEQGRTDEALRLFERVSATTNDLGLFAEEFDPESKEMLGNFPQGLTHLSQILAIVSLAGRGE